MTFIRTVITFFLTLLVTSASLGSSEIISLEKHIETEVRKTVDLFDPKALVFVKLKPSAIEESALPSVPFKVKDLKLRERSGELTIARIEVMVFTVEKRLPDALVEIIRSQLGERANFIEVKTKILPAGILPEKAVPTTDGEKMAEAMRPMFEGTNSAIGKLADAISSGWGEIGGIGRHGFSAAAALFAYLLLSTLVSVFKTKMLQKKVVEAVDSASEKLASAIQESSVASPIDVSYGGGSSQSSKNGLGSSGDEQSLLRTLSFDAVKELIADCYWSKEDGHAAFIWRRLDIEMRKKLVSEVTFLPEYVSFLAGASEKSINIDNEPYYLNPYRISHLDSKALTEIIRINPSIYSRVSSLRAASLMLSAQERVDIATSSDTDEVEIPRFETLAGSPLRRLDKIVEIRVSSTEEEAGLLANDLPIAAKRGVRSLGWLLELTDDEAKSILARYTARQLAQCWVGPDDVLTRVGALLPEKKRQLLDTYVSSQIPTRDSPVLASIHAEVMRVLEPRVRS